MNKILVYTNEEKAKAISDAFMTGNNGRIFIGSQNVVGTASGGNIPEDTYLLALTKFNGQHDGQYLMVTSDGHIIK